MTFDEWAVANNVGDEETRAIAKAAWDQQQQRINQLVTWSEAWRAVPKTVDDLSDEYGEWCKTLYVTQPSREEEYVQKTQWWFMKAKQQAFLIAELEAKLDPKS